jgi:glycosyltransferase involved in cell wall biosynthesis
MNILFVSTIFPNSHNPIFGIYSLYLLTALRDMGWTVEVINPSPYCPGIDGLLRRKNLPPKLETFNELPVTHPTFFYTPGCFVEKHYWFYRLAIGKSMKAGIARLKKRSPQPESPIHVMLGFIYPDAVAMAPICQQLGLDYSIMIYGSDFRTRMTQPKFRPLVMQCLKEAPHIFCPGYKLKEDIAKEGIDGAKIHPFNNGIDTKTFYPPQSKTILNAQNEQMPQCNSILFVGRLAEVKKADRLLKAFANLVHKRESLNKHQSGFHDLCLDIVGDGDLTKATGSFCWARISLRDCCANAKSKVPMPMQFL